MLLFTLSIFSCESDGITIPSESQSITLSTSVGNVPASVSNGFLEFASLDALDEALYTEGLIEHGIAIPGEFKSAYQAYNEFITNEANTVADIADYPNVVVIVEWDGEEYLEPVVANDALSHLANHDGLISLTTHMAKIDRDAIRVVSDKDFAKMGIVAFENAPSLESHFFKTKRTAIQKRNVISPERAEFRGRNRRGRETGPRFRLTGNLESTESLIGPNRLICRSKLFKKRGIWWGTSGRLTNEYHLFGTYNAEGFSFPYNRLEGPVSRNAQNFPLIVGSSDEFTSGNRNGVWSVGIGSLFTADVSKDRGSLVLL